MTMAAVSTRDEAGRPHASETSLHVAFVVPALHGNGAERSILRIAGGMIDSGHTVDLVLFRPVIDRPDEVPGSARLILMKEGIGPVTIHHLSRVLKVSTLPATVVPGKLQLWNCMRMLKAIGMHPLALPSMNMFREAQFVANYVEREAPDCIVSILPKGKVATLLAKALRGSFPTTIASVRNDLRFRRRREIVRYRRLLPNCDRVIAISRGVQSSVSRVVGISEEKITTIYNPVVTPDIQTLASQSVNHSWLSNKDAPVIVAAGRLSRQKDFPTLLRAFERVAAVRSVRLIILGEGRQRVRLYRLAKRLNIADRVWLPGYVPNPYAFMARASAFVLSSRFEGLGNVLIEALACGCPCISTDCPSGPAEILAHGRIGVLVPVGDYAALANAIQRTLDQPPDKSVLRRRAELFTVENSVAMYESVIRRSTTGRTIKSEMQ